jgi:hypothetical protein
MSYVGMDRTEDRRALDHRAIALPGGAVISSPPHTRAAPTRRGCRADLAGRPGRGDRGSVERGLRLGWVASVVAGPVVREGVTAEGLF